MDLTAVAFELFGTDLEELHAAGFLGDAQHVVDLFHHRAATAAAGDDRRFVTQSCAVEGSGHPCWAAANDDDIVLENVCLGTHTDTPLGEPSNTYAPQKPVYGLVTSI